MADLREAARAALLLIESANDGAFTRGETVHGYGNEGEHHALGVADALRAALDAPRAEAAPKGGAGEAVAYISALKRAAHTGDKQADRYMDDMVDEVVRIVRAENPLPSPAMGVVEAAALLARLHEVAGHYYSDPDDPRRGDYLTAALHDAGVFLREAKRAAQEPPRAKPGEGGEGGAS